MKNLLFTLTFLIFCTLSFSQTTMDIQNNISCDVSVDMYEATGTCGTTQSTYLVPAFSVITIVAPGGGLFIDAIFVDPTSGYQYGSTNGISSPVSACASTCAPSFASSSAALPESGPAGTSCASSITPTWVFGCPLGPNHGVIEIN